jgi:uncharacterized protein YdaU (DUF1376 family)
VAKTDIWMPIYINDYLGNTMELDENGHGIYLLLMFQYWKKGPLTKDTKKLMKIARTDNLELLEEILEDYFIDSNDCFIHKRVEEEKMKANTRRDIAIENGKKGGRPKGKNNPTLNPEETQPLTQSEPRDKAKCNPEESSSSSSSSSSSKTSKPSKHKYGEYNNVLLSDTEYKKLSDEWGISERDRMIKTLSEGIELKGYKYKSHYLALRKWKDNEKSGKVDQYNLGVDRVEGF